MIHVKCDTFERSLVFMCNIAVLLNYKHESYSVGKEEPDNKLF